MKKNNFCIIFLLLIGCATPTKNIWKFESGAEAYTNEKPNDSAIIKTNYGSIKILPSGIDNYFGLTIQVIIENSSNETIKYDYKNIKLQTVDKEIIDPSDEEILKANLAHVVGSAGLISGGGPLAQNNVNAEMWGKLKATMLVSGEIPPNSVKKGIIFYSQNTTPMNFTIRVDKMDSKSHVVNFGKR